MKRRALFFLLVFGSSADAGPSVDRLVTDLQKTYDQAQSIEGDFSQVYRSKRFGDKSAKGHVWFAKPGKMRWDYETPKGKVMVSNGKTVFLYDPDDHQALKTVIDKGAELPVPLSFLWGKEKISKAFEVTIASGAHTSNPTLRCVPRTEIPNVKEVFLTLRVGPKTLIQVSRVVDAFGEESEITFSNLKTDVAISKDRFDFQPPKEAPVVEMKLKAKDT